MKNGGHGGKCIIRNGILKSRVLGLALRLSESDILSIPPGKRGKN